MKIRELCEPRQRPKALLMDSYGKTISHLQVPLCLNFVSFDMCHMGAFSLGSVGGPLGTQKGACSFCMEHISSDSIDDLESCSYIGMGHARAGRHKEWNRMEQETSEVQVNGHI